MRRIKKGSAILLAAALVFSALALPKAYAAGPIETEKADCKITVNVANSKYAEGTPVFGELSTLEVPVKLYKVATVDVSGNFTGISPFNDVDFTGISIDEDEKVVAAHWEDLSAESAEIADANTSLTPITKKISNGTVEFTDLTTGLYLVYAQVTESTNYEYHFKPYLISLPGNNYDPKTEGSSDDWVYNVTVGLKPEKLDRYGDLIIKKTLDVYNSTNSNATFVFQVEASKTDVDTGEKKVVYSNVVSMAFEEAGTKELCIEKIPAGATVTVKEVYSGASYEVKSDAEDEAVIVADVKYDSVDEKEEIVEVETAEVEFSNTHNGIPHGGSGVINNFKFGNDGWEWREIDPKNNGSIVSQGAE